LELLERLVDVRVGDLGAVIPHELDLPERLHELCVRIDPVLAVSFNVVGERF
jgi:hypothetical protein